MNVPLRKSWTQDAFLSWAAPRDERYEFDGFQPVAMTGGTVNHNRIVRNLHRTLDVRLRGSPCEPLGPDAGIQTVNEAVRYPDALVTCSRVEGTAHLVTGVVVVFEVLSRTTSRTDRIVKLREYAAVSSIRRYVILESTGVGLTVMDRGEPDEAWRVVALTGDDALRMPEIGIDIPVSEIYEDIRFPEDGDSDA